MQSGNILVVNHALFFSDLALRAAGVTYLPKYDHVVFDEAHTIEDVAAQHFGLRAGEGGVGYALRHLYDVRRTKGFATSLLAGGADAKKVESLVEKVVETQSLAEGFFDRTLAWYDRHGGSNGRVRRPNFVEDDLSPALEEVSKRLREIAKELPEPANDDDAEAAGRKLEATSQADRVRELGSTVKAFVEQAMPDAVYWIESANKTPRRATLRAGPVDVADGLRTQLWSQVRGAVLTSATLCTSGGKSDTAAFAHIRRRLGLEGEVEGEPIRVEAERFGSPFHYREQVKFYVETQLPEPSDRRFNEAAAGQMLHWIEQTNGGAFVLFTSYAALTDAADRLAKPLRELGLPLFVQGRDAPPKVLLQQFREAGDGVLLGTSSFWQGVDVRGHALRNVILHKLPFAVPDEPVTQARLERIEQQGGNAFMQYSVPEAAIKLRQGFGRLIRSAGDEGIVVLLDGRILTRRYGRALLDALPDVEVIRC
jgi:ATP-dependent DNA helicase DinG